MWVRRLAWGSLAFVLFFVFTLVVGTFRMAQPAEASIFVTDVNNTMENAKTAISTYTTAINSATSVANQNKNLASMSPDGLLAAYLGVSQELADVMGLYNQYTGLMTKAQTMEQAWNGSFKSVDSIFNGIGTVTNTQHFERNQTTLKALENTYNDNMKASKQFVDTQKNGEELQAAMNRVANAVGMKEAIQASAQVEALGVKEEIKTNALLVQMGVSQAAKGQSEVMEKAESLTKRRKSAETFSKDVEVIETALKSDTRSNLEKLGYSKEDQDYYRSKGLIEK